MWLLARQKTLLSTAECVLLDQEEMVGENEQEEEQHVEEQQEEEQQEEKEQ